MKSSDTIHLRIAQVLRLSLYSALILIIISVILRFLEVAASRVVVAAGIGLVILGPVLGVVVTAIVAAALKKLKYFLAALFILVIFITAFLVGIL